MRRTRITTTPNQTLIWWIQVLYNSVRRWWCVVGWSNPDNNITDMFSLVLSHWTCLCQFSAIFSPFYGVGHFGRIKSNEQCSASWFRDLDACAVLLRLSLLATIYSTTTEWDSQLRFHEYFFRKSTRRKAYRPIVYSARNMTRLALCLRYRLLNFIALVSRFGISLVYLKFLQYEVITNGRLSNFRTRSLCSSPHERRMTSVRRATYKQNTHCEVLFVSICWPDPVSVSCLRCCGVHAAKRCSEDTRKI